MYLESGANFIGEGFAPYGLPSLARARGITSLDHECFYVPMENGPIVIVGGTQCQEILEIVFSEGPHRLSTKRVTSAAFGTASQKTSIYTWVAVSLENKRPTAVK